MADFPPELWAEITSYLPDCTVFSLMFLSRTFYALALQREYRALTANCFSRSVQLKLRTLKHDEYRARCVRSVALHPITEGNIHGNPMLPNVRWTWLDGLFQKFANRYSSLSPRKVESTLNDALLRLTNLAELVVVNDDCPASRFPKIPWNVYAANLQHLDLTMPLGKAKTLPLDVSFPQLSKFSFRPCPESDNLFDVPEHVRLTASFINGLRPTLTHLRIMHNDSISYIRDLYSALGRFPHLISLQANSPSASIGFIRRHSDQLCGLNFSSITSLSPVTLEGIEFNGLLKLTLRLGDIEASRWWTLPSLFLGSIVPTLYILNIESWILEKDFMAFLSAVEHLSIYKGSSCVLEELSLSVTAVSSTILRAIAQAFPNLRSLNLNLEMVAIGKTMSIEPTACFPYTPQQINQLLFRNNFRYAWVGIEWNLEELTIVRRDSKGKDAERILWGFMLLISDCFPSIYGFNNQGDKAIPNEIAQIISQERNLLN
ncbi:hypothetical protein FA15DRAFT_697445 [Coprinopsis marcescibilis]|uniref:F-box domain-containing protein n=1 Tax=Coprinopsis marcescibilis TaxID=230819 RepID=A0A5C3KIE0_COPMA|nr:hypothetical protein FA15DRAFT_697445 [Coprinopsis marcescibilis]